LARKSSRKTVEYELISKFKAMLKECMKDPKDEYDKGFNEGIRRAAGIFVDCVGDFVPVDSVDKDIWVAECVQRFVVLVGSQDDLSDAYEAHAIGVQRGLYLAKSIFAQFVDLHLAKCEPIDVEPQGAKRKTLGRSLWLVFGSMLDREKEKYASSVYDHGINQGLELAARYFMENAEKYVLMGESDNKEIWKAGCICVYGSDIEALKTKTTPHYNAVRVNATNAGLERSKAAFAEFVKEMWQ